MKARSFACAGGAALLAFGIARMAVAAGEPVANGARAIEYRGESSAPAGGLFLWYRRPALRRLEAQPLGNGRIGAMIFGDVRHERIGLNESTLWSGEGGGGRQAPESAGVMAKLRQAVLAKDYGQADALSRQLQGPWSEAYMPLGDLRMDFAVGVGAVEGYQRRLDLDRAVETIEYAVEGVKYRREAFISAPDGVMVMRLTNEPAGHLALNCQLTTQLKFMKNRAEGGATIVMTGKAPSRAMPNYRGGALTYAADVSGEGMNFEVDLRRSRMAGK